ncbi:hypothetical protein [Petrocella sp. FN5]|uniref:hypothetical protein n=1 Tax=Petrocella sp. FN5 TaxID=3032002 RepID=UPI0023DCA0D0|nr:hypothetical protein [Petrocella sp. FN5]MDF1616092.1 hypothetical protein [Petrocella sp. FN5]
MHGFQEIRADVLINSDDLRRRFKDVRELVHSRGNAGVLVNNRVDMVLMDIEVYNKLIENQSVGQGESV